MSGGGRVASCTVCAKIGPRTKGLCPRCYARSRIHEVVCADCGLVRLEHRGGRCANCYRLAHMALGICRLCGEQKPLWGPVCRACQVRRRATAGACEGCGREMARLWGRRCSRCAKTHWTVGSCLDCCWWTASIENGRCRACQEFASHNAAVGTCRSCDRHLPLNAYGRCRLCTVARRQAHSAGDPDWSMEPGARGGIQLCFGELYAHPGPLSTVTTTRRHFSADVSANIAGEKRLFPVPPDLSRITGLDLAALKVSGTVEEAAIKGFAEARGWKPETTLAVLQAMALLEGQGPGYPSDEIFSHLRRLGLRPSRVREFLAAQGRTPPEQLALHTGSTIRSPASPTRSRPRWPHGSRCSKVAGVAAEPATVRPSGFM